MYKYLYVFDVVDNVELLIIQLANDRYNVSSTKEDGNYTSSYVMNKIYMKEWIILDK